MNLVPEVIENIIMDDKKDMEKITKEIKLFICMMCKSMHIDPNGPEWKYICEIHHKTLGYEETWGVYELDIIKKYILKVSTMPRNHNHVKYILCFRDWETILKRGNEEEWMTTGEPYNNLSEEQKQEQMLHFIKIQQDNISLLTIEKLNFYIQFSSEKIYHMDMEDMNSSFRSDGFCWHPTGKFITYYRQ
jgi:hypothetical protein